MCNVHFHFCFSLSYKNFLHKKSTLFKNTEGIIPFFTSSLALTHFNTQNRTKSLVYEWCMYIYLANIKDIIAFVPVYVRKKKLNVKNFMVHSLDDER